MYATTGPGPNYGPYPTAAGASFAQPPSFGQPPPGAWTPTTTASDSHQGHKNAKDPIVAAVK
jgi:hypothetical protein